MKRLNCSALNTLLFGLITVAAQAAAPSSPLTNWVAWGAGGPNQSGDPHFGQSVIPPLGDEVAALAAGGYHNAALRPDGTVYCWGRNDQGQCDVPINLIEVKQITAGHLYSMALTKSCSVFHWGASSYGMRPIPATVTNVVSIAAGASHCVALRKDGQVIAWGYEGWGATNVPPGLNNVVAVAAGQTMSAALKSDGTVTTWGLNEVAAPAGLSGVVQVVCGSTHVVALKNDGTVVAWGSSPDGATLVPPGLSNVIQVGAGLFHSVALKADGSVVAWGAKPPSTNYYGQTAVPPGLTARRLASGFFHVVAEQGDPAPLVAADSDHDGLSDYVELFRLGTDATNKDSDGDSYNDGIEVALGSGPLDAAWVPAQPLFAAEAAQLATFGFRISVVAPAQGETLVIEKSSDLRTWERFVIMPNPARTFEIADPGATSAARTFYRAVAH